MAQGVLPFQYEEEGRESGLTGHAGLGVYVEMAHKLGLEGSIRRHVGVREGKQGWNDYRMIMSLILLNLAGGDCVEDLRILEADEGFCRIMEKAVCHGMSRGERREQAKRFRKERTRSFPSASSVFRYLSAFHDSEQEKLRKHPETPKAFIPKANEYLRGLSRVNADIAAFVQVNHPQRVATLDMDATLARTRKSEALFDYKGDKSYQPLNTWWDEQGMVLHTEFRDGNVPAGYEQLRVFKEALACLPCGVEKVRVRSDTAGYQHDLLAYCEKGMHPRFGRIEFAIGCDVTPEFKKAVLEVQADGWMPLFKEVEGKRVDTGMEWAEVCFVPNEIAKSKKGPSYRYLALRERMHEQLSLPGMGEKSYPFPTVDTQGHRYKLFGVVTNLTWSGDEVICWLHKRCGRSEEAHAIMKEDLAGGKFPSGDFGENAAWWWIMLFSFNLHAAMKMLALSKGWARKRMKAVRFALINIPARVLEHARRLVIRLTRAHPSFGEILNARERIAHLVPVGYG
jgi:hypothetical protein